MPVGRYGTGTSFGRLYAGTGRYRYLPRYLKTVDFCPIFYRNGTGTGICSLFRLSMCSKSTYVEDGKEDKKRIDDECDDVGKCRKCECHFGTLYLKSYGTN